jgi:hypothetical protein
MEVERINDMREVAESMAPRADQALAGSSARSRLARLTIASSARRTGKLHIVWAGSGSFSTWRRCCPCGSRRGPAPRPIAEGSGGARVRAVRHLRRPRDRNDSHDEAPELADFLKKIKVAAASRGAPRPRRRYPAWPNTRRRSRRTARPSRRSPPRATPSDQLYRSNTAHVDGLAGRYTGVLRKRLSLFRRVPPRTRSTRTWTYSAPRREDRRGCVGYVGDRPGKYLALRAHRVPRSRTSGSRHRGRVAASSDLPGKIMAHPRSARDTPAPSGSPHARPRESLGP